MFTLDFSDTFKVRVEKLTAKDLPLKKKTIKALTILTSNPKHRSLRSHKVTTKDFGEKWSSWVTGDIRIIWDYHPAENQVIQVFSIGGHSGKDKVYN